MTNAPPRGVSMANPIEWLEWIYGKWFIGHPWRGFFTILVVSCMVISLAIGILWLKALDEYAKDHPDPKQQTVTAINPVSQSVTVQDAAKGTKQNETQPATSAPAGTGPAPATPAPTARLLPDCTVDIAFRPTGNSTPLPPLSEVQTATTRLVDKYREQTGQCPKNDWLNEQLTKQNYPVWANVNCEAHGTGILVNGQETHFNQDVDIETLPCDIGINVGNQAKVTTFGGKIKIRVAKPGQGDSVFIH